MDRSPIACSLSAADYRQRLSAIREFGRLALLEAEDGPDGALLSFRSSAGVRDGLASIVDAERECCSLLDLTIGSDGDRMTLAISAPPDAMPVVRDLTRSFQGAAMPDP